MTRKSKLGLLSISSISVLIWIVLFSNVSATSTDSYSVSDPEGEVVFDLVVDVGCKIGLGNDEEKISPSEQWKYHLEFTDINGYYYDGEILNLTSIIEELVEEWIEANVKNDGRRKKMLERYVIVDYSYEITEYPEPPPS